jgi:hypothetical protein
VLEILILIRIVLKLHHSENLEKPILTQNCRRKRDRPKSCRETDINEKLTNEQETESEEIDAKKDQIENVDARLGVAALQMWGDPQPNSGPMDAAESFLGPDFIESRKWKDRYCE